ncbi:alkaline phosphatase [Brachybacterium phenoliresistens]|uniref:Alkaline phosphatase n=1 Tax=Brachybacterium phenoliresistens TaxID=396014 RepID=Z9JPC4_9MICO|nr:DeoR/GlpR family DNA-binding transcription regulator [Brachybacterium phenoliresistens]EWS79641.1 alkaline phosphatase [Brachybacterium phenoliresistens]
MDQHASPDRAARGMHRSRRERLDDELNLIMERGHIAVEELTEELGVSPATVRRDLDHLAGQQLVIRTRGGASAHSSAAALPLRYRASRHARAKEAIARTAAGLARPGSVVGLNGGTTTTTLAHELSARAEFVESEQQTVLVTNAVNIAQELAVRSHLQMVVTGGVVREQSFELVGSWAEQLLAQIRIDTLFLGVNAISAADGARTHNEAEASINARLVERAHRVVVIADSSKVLAHAFALICPIGRVDALVTDAGIDPEELAALRAAGVEVHLADAADEGEADGAADAADEPGGER